jgi:hypothetical protein
MLLFVLRLLPLVKCLAGDWRRSERELENNPAVLCLELGNASRSAMDQVGSGLAERDLPLLGEPFDHRICVRLLQPGDGAAFLCGCPFDGAFSKGDVRPRPEKAKSAPGPVNMSGIECEPTAISTNNMAQMPPVIDKGTDGGRIVPCGCAQPCGLRLANSVGT